MLKKSLLVGVAAAAAFGLATSAWAAFPEKDITLVVPWAAGGGTDTLARILVKNAQKHIGVNVNVINKTGGSGSIGMNDVARARPDGYTVGVLTFDLARYRLSGLAPLSYRDFGLIMLLNQNPGAITVREDSPFKTLKDLIEFAKAHPGELTAGHTGAGGAWHLGLVTVATQAGAKLNYVPFDGAAPTRTALLGGHVAIAATGIDEVQEFYKDKKVRILSVNNTVRHPLFPDVPTLAEAGYPLEAPVLDWRGLGAPKGIPADRMKVLADGFKKCFEDPEFQEAAKARGLILKWADSAGFEKFLADMEITMEAALKAVDLYKPVQ